MNDFTWETDCVHKDNTETMNDYIETQMPDEYWLIVQYGSYAEIIDDGCIMWAAHASGDGDFTHHRIRFERVL